MISYADRDLFYQDSVGKQLSITFTGGSFTNSDLIENDFTLEEMLNSDSDLHFGECNSSCVTFTVGYYENSIIGKELIITTTPTGGSAFQLGKYTVVSDEANDDRNRRKIVAYDRLYDILRTNCISWYNTLLPNTSTTKTLKQFRDSFFTYLGVEQTSQTLPNDNMTVTRTLEATVLTGKDILNKICEINGCFGKIGRDEKFKYVFLEEPTSGLFPATTLYPSASLYPSRRGFSTAYDHTYIKLVYEDYETQVINKLALQNGRGENQVVLGSGTNVYFVSNNFLIFGKSNGDLTTIGNNMLAKIQNRWYRPVKLESVGDPCIETGDALRLFRDDEFQVNTYVFKRTLKGIQSLKDKFVSDGLKAQANDLNTTSSQITQVKDNVRRIEADYVKTTYLEANYVTTTYLTSNYITANQIESNYLKTSAISTITLDASQITTGTLSADRINASSISVDKLNVNTLMANTILNSTNKDTTSISLHDLQFRGYYLYLQPVTIGGDGYLMLGFPNP